MGGIFGGGGNSPIADTAKKVVNDSTNADIATQTARTDTAAPVLAGGELRATTQQMQQTQDFQTQASTRAKSGGAALLSSGNSAMSNVGTKKLLGS